MRQFSPLGYRVGWGAITLILLCIGSPNRLLHHYLAALVGITPLFLLCWDRPLRGQLRTAFVIWFCFCAYVFTPDLISVKVLRPWEILGGLAVAPILPLFYVAATLLSLRLTVALAPVWRPLAMATVWTGLDGLMGLLWFPIPFHWGSLVFDWPLGIQIADLTGIWGVTWFAVLINAGLAVAIREGMGSRSGWQTLLVTLGIGAGVVSYGLIRMPMVMAVPGSSYTIGAVQQVAWLETTDRSWGYRNQRYLDLLQMSYQAVQRGAELMVWSEGAMRAQFAGTSLESYIMKPMSQMLPDGGGVLLGAVQPDESMSDQAPDQQQYLNAALLYDAEGTLLDSFGKQWIFPYFESSRYVPSEGGYLPLQGGESLGQIGAMVCLESVLPEPSRRLVNAGAQLLVAISDDSWFGNSHWPMLHGNLSIFRAVENRRDFVFVNNTGGNLIVAASGQVRHRGRIFEQDVIVGDVQLRQDRTLYSWAGDWFSWLAIGGTAGLGIWSWRRRKYPAYPVQAWE